MSPKILGQAGISLADAYDIEGSEAGVSELLSREVQVVHEMGGVLMAERLTPDVRRITTGAILQNATWDLTLVTNLETPARILGVTVFFDTAARVDRAQVSVRDVGAGRDFPIWAWNTAVDGVCITRMEAAGAGVANLQLMRPTLPPWGDPSMIFGSAQPQPNPDIVFRGLTTGFGAGTVTVQASIYTVHATPAGLSSFGLPIPSW